MHQDPGERNSDPTGDYPGLACGCPGVSSEGVGQWWPAAGLGAWIVAVYAWDLLREVIIHYLHHSLVNSREGKQLHSQQKIGLKIY